MIRFSNKFPIKGQWTVTVATGDIYDRGISAFGWRWARFGIFKLNEDLVEGQHIKSVDYSGFILMWDYFWPIKRSW